MEQSEIVDVSSSKSAQKLPFVTYVSAVNLPPEHFCFFSSKSTSIEGLLELVVKVLVDRKRWIVFTSTRTETKLTFYGQYFLQTKRVGERNGNYHWHSSYQLQRVRGGQSRNHRAIAVQLKRWIHNQRTREIRKLWKRPKQTRAMLNS